MTSNDRQMGEEGKHCSQRNHKALNLYLSVSTTGFQFFGSQTSVNPLNFSQSTLCSYHKLCN